MSAACFLRLAVLLGALLLLVVRVFVRETEAETKAHAQREKAETEPVSGPPSRNTCAENLD